MHKVSAAFVCTLLLVGGVPVRAQDLSPPLTLRDAITLALSTAATAQASDAVRTATSLMERARSAPRTGVATIARAEPETGNTRYLLVEEFTIDLGSAIGRLGTLQAAQAQLAQSAATLATTQRATASAVLAAFFNVVVDESQQSALAESIGLATRTMQAAVARHQTGAAPELDVERASGALAAAQAEGEATTAALAGDRAALTALVGRAFQAVTLPPVPGVLPDTTAAVEAAMRTNPDVLAARAALAASQAALLLARSQLTPGISLGLGVGVSREAGVQTVGPAADAAFSVPLASTLPRANVASAEAAVIVSKASLEQTQRGAAQSVLRALTMARSAQARLPALQVASQSAQRVAEADLAGYRLGAVTSADLIAAQTQAATARATLQTATTEALEAYARLEFEMGALGS
jgi:outer membrane protein